MYRKEIKILDCTIRDGGLMNNHKFSNELVRKVFEAINNSGVDYIELGYKADENQFSRHEYGPMKFCSEKDLEVMVNGNEKNCKISVMVDIFLPSATTSGGLSISQRSTPFISSLNRLSVGKPLGVGLGEDFLVGVRFFIYTSFL